VAGAKLPEGPSSLLVLDLYALVEVRYVLLELEYPFWLPAEPVAWLLYPAEFSLCNSAA
jgi:hypothetical protein